MGIDAASIVAPNKTFSERWDGTAWTIAAVPTPAGSKSGQLSSVSCRSADSCYAVGLSSNASATKTLVEHWSRSHWSIVSSANPNGASSAGLSGVSCASASVCVAVGTYSARDSFFTLAETGS